MVARTRTRRGYVSGFYTDSRTAHSAYSTRQNHEESCSDVIKEGDNAPFSVERYTINGGLISGKETSRSVITWTGYPGDALDTASNRSHVSLSSPQNSFYASELLKRTNPSRPSVDTAVAIAELRELPSLVRDTGSFRWKRLMDYIGRTRWGYLKKAAKLNLMIQFGILPLISDAQKLLIFQKYVDQRMGEIERLRTRGLRRTVVLDRISAQDSGSFVLQSNRVFVTMDRDRNTSLTVRGHVRYKTTERLDIVTDENLRRRALKIVTGQVIDFSTIWELLPWSWLIDWYLNVGNIVSGKRNLLSTTHDTPRIMRHTKTQITAIARPVGLLSVTPISATVERKTRALAPALLSAQLPILTNRQLSILGSLSVRRL